MQEARQLLGEPGVQGAVAGQEPLIQQADVQLDVLIVHLGAFLRRAHGMAEAQPGIPECLEERGDRFARILRQAVVLHQQQQIDVGIRERDAAGRSRPRRAASDPAGKAGHRDSPAARSTMPSTSAVRSASARIGSLQGGVATIVVPNPDGLRHVVDEDLAVADLAGARRGGQGVAALRRSAASLTTISIFTLGSRSTLYSRPR